MKHYIDQLVSDIEQATEAIEWPFVKRTELSIHDWRSPEEEEATAPVRNLAVWTRISGEMLPPEHMLTDEQVSILLLALTKLVAECNCHVVFQTQVPDRFQYESIRQNFDQEIKLREWNDGFFEFCKPGTPLKTCALKEYCQCAFYKELHDGFIDEDLSPEEERAHALENEVSYIRRKYGDDFMKYYPYHLDKNYDDEFGNPHDYGMDDSDEEDEDDWWRK